MRLASLLAAISSVLITTTTALPATTSPPFELTKLRIDEVEGGNTTFKFTIHDPDPLTNATHACKGMWKTGSGGYPQGSYKACGNSTFAWNIQSWNDVTSFVLGLEHVFEDPNIGAPPWDEVTNFAKANISEEVVVCTALGGEASCQLPSSMKILAKIYATIAKR